MQEDLSDSVPNNIRMQQDLKESMAMSESGVKTAANSDVMLESENECIRKNDADSKASATSVSIERELASNQSKLSEADPLNEVSGMASKVIPIVNFEDNLILVSSNAEIQAVFVNFNLECDVSPYNTKDSCLENKRKRVLSKLASYYESSSISLVRQSDQPRCITSGPGLSSVENILVTTVTETGGRANDYCKSKNSSDVKSFNDKSNLSFQDSNSTSNNLERRFVLIGPTVDKNNDDSLATKKLLSRNKPYFSPQSSPAKFSPGKASPSRRKSIMHPLTCSPSSSDYMERKYLDFSPSSPCSFSGEHLSKLNAPLVLLSNDLINKGTSMDTEEQLVSRKRSRDSGEELTEIAAKKMKTELSNIFDDCDKKKEKRPYVRRKTPHIVLSKFNKKRKKPSSALSTSAERGGMPNGPEEYEVEYLESHKVLEDNQCVFYVKWVGWDSRDNSWEPITNLLNCQEKLVDYFGKLLKAGKRQDLQILLNNAALSRQRQALSQASDEEVNKLLASYRSKSGLQLPSPNKEFIEKALHLLSKQRPEEVINSSKEKLKHELLLEKLYVKRKVQLNALKEWELEINFLAQNSAQITVENNFDLEGPPPNFSYINHYLPGAGVIIPNDPPFGCDCAGGCTEKSQQCCGKESGFAYDDKSRIKVPCGTPIYECNNRCTCSVKCRNRVIQRGQNHRLCIFKTFNGCGWGVKTLEDIKKGSFITKYVGEVVTADEAAVRAKSDSKFYLFDLDFNCPDNSPCPFTVDASIYGNISHFINHSCDPNLAIYAAWINCLDPNIPLLVLFAIKDIKKGDELCFSYSRTDTTRRGKGEVKCRCSASNCRKYVF